MSAEYLLPPDWMVQLERMSLGSAKRVAGTLQGKRRSSRLGSSLEFADYRPYAPGDDIRRFDWGVYARTGKPFVRQFMDEQELMVSLYVDCSASMDFGGGTEGREGKEAIPSKLRYAKQLAASIGYVALCSYERLQACCFSSRIDGRLPVLRGRGAAHRLFRFLLDAAPGEEGSLAAAFSAPGAMPRLPGMTWIFSDFWLDEREEDLGLMLSRLRGAGQEVVLVQVLAPEEIDPAYSGDLRLIDSELGTGKDIAFTGKVLRAYQDELERYQEYLMKLAADRGMTFIRVSTDMSLQKAVFGVMAEAGLVIA
ncbi:DUF58 domain-containing protein [Paenibacillus sp. XY044]|uniref:DUF58 domain-containing protein n=1 Tax=Paenibacillus sp. XY044 TaxID=2026089 RepID=UPI000B98CD3F|nr:DUF58 domain-containing protein [Paenibacillus sp. XY044]OZB96083.1 DUF58 domain-containing protein [Paenibacillus sp. XY044]